MNFRYVLNKNLRILIFFQFSTGVIFDTIKAFSATLMVLLLCLQCDEEDLIFQSFSSDI